MSSNSKSWARNLLEDINERQINTIVTDAIVGESPGHPINSMIQIAKVYFIKLDDSGIKQSDSEETEYPFSDLASVKADAFTFGWLETYAARVLEKAPNRPAEDRSIYERIQSKSKFLKEVAKRIKTAQGEPVNFSGYYDGLEGPRLNLSGKDRARIAQAWEFGTSSIAIQTTIGLDGDLVTLISRNRLDERNAILREIHDKSVQTSINTWESLLRGLSRLAQAIIE